MSNIASEVIRMFRPGPHDNARDFREKLWKYADLAKDYIPKVNLYDEIYIEAELISLNKLNDFLKKSQTEELEQIYEIWKTKIDSWKEILVKEKLTKLPKVTAEKYLTESKTEAVAPSLEQPPTHSKDWYSLYSEAIDLFNEAMLQTRPYSQTLLEKALDCCKQFKTLNIHFPHLNFLCGKIYEQLESPNLQNALINFEDVYYPQEFATIASHENQEMLAQAQQKITKITGRYHELIDQAYDKLDPSHLSETSLKKALEDCNQAIKILPSHAYAFYIRGGAYRALASLEADANRKKYLIELAITDLRTFQANFVPAGQKLTAEEEHVNRDARKILKELICSKIQVECDIDNTLLAGECHESKAKAMKQAFARYTTDHPRQPEVKALQFLNPIYDYQGKQREEYYVIFPGTIEFRKWIDDLGIKFSYYSTGLSERNNVLCQQLQSKLNLNVNSHMPKVTSRDGCYDMRLEKDPDEYKNIETLITEQKKKYGIQRTFGYKKILADLHLDNLDHTVLIDNMLDVIFPREEKNALCTNSYVEPKDFFMHFSKIDNNTIESILKLNQIFGIVGVMNKAIDMTVENGKPFLDNLFSLQFKPNKQSTPTSQLFQKIDETYTPVDFFATERLKYFNAGLKILRKYNPKLQFYGHGILEKLVNEQEKQAALSKPQTQNNPVTP